ncbi:transposase [Caballeronia sordidicola]|uniref:Mobile element protein n=1 Tax=Caballeronia sordidicola TaxID=196367 RepID=A0A242N6S1_CABSO|nr:transposase [Caballeronia sordidicola]OTP79357.1 Mobile element protein [Caballeronia sordidicola]
MASTGKVRVLMTNLLDSARYPASQFGDLYHQRWRIEEAFKRLKHRLNLEHVSGLSQRAVAQDLAARVLCDNLQALTTLTAHTCHELPPDRRINRAYVHSVLKPLLPSLLLGIAAATSLADVLALIAAIRSVIGQDSQSHANPVRNPTNP